MRIINFLSPLLMISALGCTLNRENNPVAAQEKKVACIPYFDFDKVEHYSIIIEEKEFWKMYEKKKKTVDEKKLIELILGYSKETISDTVILNDMVKAGYKKSDIAESKLKPLRALFCERKHKDAMYSGCAPYFRDILIFKRKIAVVGIAKICFTCGHSVIVGSKLNTMEFGQSGDYERLQKLLYN